MKRPPKELERDGAFSQIGNGANEQQLFVSQNKWSPSDDNTRQEFRNASSLLPTIFNGDFEYGIEHVNLPGTNPNPFDKRDPVDWNQIPGWSIHGGGIGKASESYLVAENGNHQVKLGGGSYPNSITHNRLYIPDDAEVLRLYATPSQTALTSSGYADLLRVIWRNPAGPPLVLYDRSIQSNDHNALIFVEGIVPPGLIGSVGTLSIELQDGTAFSVEIDEVHFAKVTEPWPTAITLSQNVPKPGSDPLPLQNEHLRMAITDAKEAWLRLGSSSHSAALIDSTSIQVQDLPDAVLGITLGSSVLLDDDASGYGRLNDVAFRRRQHIQSDRPPHGVSSRTRSRP